MVSNSLNTIIFCYKKENKLPREGLNAWVWSWQSHLASRFSKTCVSPLASRLVRLQQHIWLDLSSRQLQECSSCPLTTTSSPNPTLHKHKLPRPPLVQHSSPPLHSPKSVRGQKRWCVPSQTQSRAPLAGLEVEGVCSSLWQDVSFIPVSPLSSDNWPGLVWSTQRKLGHSWLHCGFRVFFSLMAGRLVPSRWWWTYLFIYYQPIVLRLSKYHSPRVKSPTLSQQLRTSASKCEGSARSHQAPRPSPPPPRKLPAFHQSVYRPKLIVQASTVDRNEWSFEAALAHGNTKAELPFWVLWETWETKAWKDGWWWREEDAEDRTEGERRSSR